MPSAYVLRWNVDRDFSKLLVNRMNRRVPKRDPCGMPQVASCFSEFSYKSSKIEFARLYMLQTMSVPFE